MMMATVKCPHCGGCSKLSDGNYGDLDIPYRRKCDRCEKEFYMALKLLRDSKELEEYSRRNKIEQ